MWAACPHHEAAWQVLQDGLASLTGADDRAGNDAAGYFCSPRLE